MNTQTAGQWTIRTEAMVGREVMGRLSRCRVAAAGAGGVGGAVLASLARMGVGRFRIADPGVFDEPDLNRQWACTRETMGGNKAEVYETFIHEINPAAEVEVFREGFTEENSERFVDGVDIFLEALDVAVAPALRVRAAQLCRERGIPCILPPIVGFGCLVATAMPGGEKMERFQAFLERARRDRKLPPGIRKFFNPAPLDAMEASMGRGVIPSMNLAIALVTSIVTTEMLWIIGGRDVPGFRPPVALPNLILADLSKPWIGVKDISELETA